MIVKKKKKRCGILPGSGLCGRGRAVHGYRSGEVNETAGATKAGSGCPRERDVGVLEGSRNLL